MKNNINHLSFSALSTYLGDPYKFRVSYIDRAERKEKTYFLLGKAFHLAVECILIGSDALTSWIAAKEEIDAGIPKLGHDQLDEKDIEKLKTNIYTYYDMYKDGTIGYTSKATELYINNVRPIKYRMPISGAMDVITTDGGIVDHKYVGAHSSNVKWSYKLQAWFYYHLYKSEFKEAPLYCQFDEFRKTPYRIKKGEEQKSQLNRLVVMYTPEMIAYFDHFYKMKSAEIKRLKYEQFLPNVCNFMDSDGAEGHFKEFTI